MTHYLVAAALILGFAGGWQTQEWRAAYHEQERRQQVEDQRRRAEKNVDVAAGGHERDKREIRTEFITITQEVERVVEKPFYVAGEQCLDDDGLRQLGAAIGAAAAASQPARAVPGPAGAR